MGRSQVDIEQENLFKGGRMSHEPCGDIMLIKKVIFGNGVTGLAKKVEDHGDYISKQIGSLNAIKWLLGFVSLGEVALIVKAFLK